MYLLAIFGWCSLARERLYAMSPLGVDLVRPGCLMRISVLLRQDISVSISSPQNCSDSRSVFPKLHAGKRHLGSGHEQYLLAISIIGALARIPSQPVATA